MIGFCVFVHVFFHLITTMIALNMMIDDDLDLDPANLLDVTV